MVDMLKNKYKNSISVAYKLPYLRGIGILVFDFISLERIRTD